MTTESVRAKSSGHPSLAFVPAGVEDIDRLVDLKVEVMRGELERLGRYTPERARRRFVDGFSPDSTRLIHRNGRFAGCVTVHDRGEHIEIEHLYLPPSFHGTGLGSRIMAFLMEEARVAGKPVRVTVLNGSPANRFYQRLGFTETDRDAIDINYIWTP